MSGNTTGSFEDDSPRTLQEAVERVLAEYRDARRRIEKDKVYGAAAILAETDTAVDHLTTVFEREMGCQPQIQRYGYQKAASGASGYQERHEAYGLVQLNKTFGGRTLFGSPANHPSFYTLHITRGSRVMEEHGQRFRREGRELVSIALSPAQFVAMITEMNSGDGVPCTIEHVNGVRMDPAPYPTQTEAEFFLQSTQGAMRESVADTSAALRDLTAILEKPKLSQEDRRTIRFLFESLQKGFAENVPFMIQRIQDSFDRMVANATVDAESAIRSRLMALGVESVNHSFAKTALLPEKSEDQSETDS